jgi:hypothetical protein
MKKKLFWVVLAVLLALGMALVSCGDGSGGSNNEPKSITITGLSGKSGTIEVVLDSIVGGRAKDIALGTGTISGDSATVPLYEAAGNGDISNVIWTGSGGYYLAVRVLNYAIYIYTNGKTLAELGVSSNFSEDEKDLVKLPKINITGADTTVAFDKFQRAR